ncbi:MAG TPA: glycosyltransferase family 4 protein [Pyrinomonadaceae bacterium]|jgi:glycosyltransferase involved in cell wall biosynthesis
MHVVFLTMEYPPLPSGGIGTSVRNLGRALVRQGHRVSVLGTGPLMEFEDEGVRVRFIGETRVPKVGWLWDARRVERELNRLVREEGADIVEAHDWGGVSAGVRPRCPIVVRCNGTDTYFARLLQKRVRPSVRWAEGLALRSADDLVAVSRFTADVTRHLFNLRADFGVIPNGIDVTQFKPATNGEVERNTILYFGTLARKKGVLDLCRAFSGVVERNREARLRLVGRDMRDQLSGSDSTWEVCRSLLSPAAQERVEYLGAQPYDRMQEYVRRASLCVFPSYAEAFPLSWLEAMASAKAVVAYDTGWAPEVIESGTSGVLVPPGDRESLAQAIEELLAERTRARLLGQAARCRVEKYFAAEVVARQTIARYEKVLGQGR